MKEKRLDLSGFKEQLKIVTTKKDSKGNQFNSYGTLNASSWIGENSGLLIDEIETLRSDNAALINAGQVLSLVIAEHTSSLDQHAGVIKARAVLSRAKEGM